MNARNYRVQFNELTGCHVADDRVVPCRMDKVFIMYYYYFYYAVTLPLKVIHVSPLPQLPRAD